MIPTDSIVFTALLPISILIAALFFGPLPIVLRGVIRGALDPHHVRRWFRPATLGLATGMVLAALLMTSIDPAQTRHLVLICLLLLLAVIDWQWRWLPIEWTFAVISLGMLDGLIAGSLLQTAVQIAAPSLTILLIRQVLQALMGRPPLGLGDIWLIAGLGAFLPATLSFLMIGLAGLSGLAELAIRRLLSGNRQKSAAVSYGTHLCVVFVVLRSFPQIN
ncbi:prepilin peptidase [Cognatiyoonia sp. IB215446]|uniref:prepilin peptidase n=1 Tax=Cognatiyoonia sp. IB215446 TaxID=3097355 RepID=UPI002A15937D|nr:prepilin peptidase [Cognatiyoonia sp. IB215446]MDX8349128.1 prepilin peptidase [Cognatiyoonia sp. IB215446]